MAPSSITVKIDFGSDNATGTTNNVSVSSGAPTPFSSGGEAVAASGRSSEALPTPFANGTQGVEQTGGAAPPIPSPSLAPAGSMGSGNDASSPGGVPTPFSSGGFSPASTGESAHVIPTPLDNIAHGMGSTVGQAPTPHFGAAGHADAVAPEPSLGSDDDGGRKGKK